MTLNWIHIVCGVVIGLFGWLLYWAGLPIVGAVVGAGAGGALGYLFSGLFQASWAGTALTIGGLLGGGIAGILLIHVLQLYFFFATGASLGGAVAWQMIHQEPLAGLLAGSGNLGILVVVGLGALGGGLLLISLRRFLIAIVTSIIGAVIFAMGVPAAYQLPALVISLVVFVTIQIGVVRRFVDQDQFDKYSRAKFRDEVPDVRKAD